MESVSCIKGTSHKVVDTETDYCKRWIKEAGQIRKSRGTTMNRDRASITSLTFMMNFYCLEKNQLATPNPPLGKKPSSDGSSR